MTMTSTRDMTALARELRPQIEAFSEEAERIRRLPDGLVSLLSQHGFFDMMRPKQYGGMELDLATSLSAIEEVSVADASAGWCVGIGGGAIGIRNLPEAVAREIFPPGVPTAGVGAPMGRARPADGGYVINGRWGYASGCHHAKWIAMGSLVFDGDQPRVGSNGIPEFRIAFARTSEVEILDTWHVSGLRGTGSCDIEATDVFVPNERTVAPLLDPPVLKDSRFGIPMFTIFGLPIMPAALGAARRAIDEVVEMAQGKTPMMNVLSGAKLRERAVVQHEIARAEAILQGGRAFLYQTVEALWDQAGRGEAITMEMRGRVRLASTHATECAAQAVDIAYKLGGGTSNYESSVLQRCFRDVHAVTQHVVIASTNNYETVGRIMLGLDAGTPLI